jgi:protein ATS1
LQGAEVVDVAPAAHHSLLLLRIPEAGEWRYELYGVGTNTYGQLGRRCALRNEGAPPQSWPRWRRLSLLPSHMGDGWEPKCIGATWTTSFVVYRRSIAAAGSSSSAGASSSATAKGDVEEIIVAEGSNDFGELGVAPAVRSHDDDGDKNDDMPAAAGPRVVDIDLDPGDTIAKICCGQRHVLCVVQGAGGGQRLIGWGASRKGELDLPYGRGGGTSRTGTEGTSAIASGSISILGKGSDKGKSKGNAFAASRPLAPARTSLPHTLNLDVRNDERITRLAAGASHSVALLSSGRLLAWGSDAKGQITGLNELDGVIDAACTWNGTFVKADGGVWSQGSNTHSQLVRSTLSEVYPICGSDEVGDINGGRGDRGDVVQGRGLVQWAEEACERPLPQPNDPSTKASQRLAPATRTPSSPAEVERVVCGTEHVLVQTKAGQLWAGGWNEHGNLGLGDNVDRGKLERVDVAGEVRGVWAGCAATWVWMD